MNCYEITVQMHTSQGNIRCNTFQKIVYEIQLRFITAATHLHQLKHMKY